jgi:hypothetical protein
MRMRAIALATLLDAAFDLRVAFLLLVLFLDLLLRHHGVAQERPASPPPVGGSENDEEKAPSPSRASGRDPQSARRGSRIGIDASRPGSGIIVPTVS